MKTLGATGTALKAFSETATKAQALVAALLEQRDDLSKLPLPPEAKRYARMPSGILFRKGGQAKFRLYLDAAAALTNQRGKKKKKKKGFKNYAGSAYSPSPKSECVDQEGRLLEGPREFLIRARTIQVKRDPHHEDYLAIPVMDRSWECWTNLFKVPPRGAETAFRKRLETLVRTRRGYRPGDLFVSELGNYRVTDDLNVKKL